MNNGEIQHRKCKKCSLTAIRVNIGTFTKKCSKRWVGEGGRLWNGKICPQCQADVAKVNMRRLRAERKAK